MIFLFFYSKHYRIKATLILSPSFRLPYIIDHGGGEGRGGGVCALWKAPDGLHGKNFGQYEPGDSIYTPHHTTPPCCRRSSKIVRHHTLLKTWWSSHCEKIVGKELSKNVAHRNVKNFLPLHCKNICWSQHCKKGGDRTVNKKFVHRSVKKCWPAHCKK